MIMMWKAITSPAGLAVIAALAFTGILYYVYQEGKSNGAAAVIEEQNKADRQVIQGSRSARDAVDRCYARGGVWQRETGTCSQ